MSGVVLGGTGWSSSLAGGYAIPTGSGEQLLPLPWTGIDRLSVTFSEDVLIELNDLALYGVNIPQYDIGAGTFSYDSATFTATWTLPEPLGADRLVLWLNADGESPIRDAAGNRLDGEWDNPTGTTDLSSDTYPSGDGAAGGDFVFCFNVLPGDADGSGVVDQGDLDSVFPQIGSLATVDTPWDIDRDGVVAYADMYAAFQRFGNTISLDEPAAPLELDPLDSPPDLIALAEPPDPPAADGLSLVAAAEPIAVVAEGILAGDEPTAAAAELSVAGAELVMARAELPVAGSQDGRPQDIAPIPLTIDSVDRCVVRSDPVNSDPLNSDPVNSDPANSDPKSGIVNSDIVGRAAAHDAVLAEAARQDAESPAAALARWDWIVWYDLEQLRQKKRTSARIRPAGEPTDSLLSPRLA